MARKTVDLNALIENDGGEILVNDETHRVLPISGAAIELYRSEGGDQLKKAYAVAGLCVPTLATEALNRLSPKQIAAILDMALDDVNAAEKEAAEVAADRKSVV